MRTVEEILAEIDRQKAEVNCLDTLNDYQEGRYGQLCNLKDFILSEPEKCEHEFVNLGLNPDFNYSNAYFLQKCTKCGEIRK